MSRPLPPWLRRHAPTGALIAALIIAWWATWRDGYDQGRQEEAQRPYRRLRDTLIREIRTLETRYHHDTVTLWKIVRDVDTLMVIDSIPVIAGDSARAAQALRLTTTGLNVCVGALSTCEQRVAAERRLRQAAESALTAGGGHGRKRAFWAGAAAGAATVLLLRR